jgi:flagellar protein FliO/FliZ
MDSLHSSCDPGGRRVFLGKARRAFIAMTAAGAVVIVGLWGLAEADAPGTGAPASPLGPWNDPNGLLSENTGVTGGLILRTIVSLAIVVGLGAGAAYLLRRMGPRLHQIQGKQIRVVETTGLGPKKALHIVEVGRQRFLIGSTPEQVTLLAQVTPSEAQAGHGSLDPGKGV